LEQIVYILDQVRALEDEIIEKLQLQGLDIKPQIVVVRKKKLAFLYCHLL
jgi:sucrose synthase